MGGKTDAAKTRSEAGATPSCRKIAARSLRASGVTPASCCWNTQLVFWPRRKRGIRTFVRQDVRHNRKGGTEEKYGNHQGTTQATKVSDDPGASRGVGENAARSIREVHRLHSVVRHYGGSESPIQARRRVQSLARPTRQRTESRTDSRRGSHKDRVINMKTRP